ncbi:hypothetical protein ON010_g9577 [Phytophthora cinnamomi]|nr:hypothetical protein ON010_g9577 [Phytophthora cinnamomi]
MLFFDQPVGTGYSSVRDEVGHVNTQEEVAEQLYRGLQGFFRRHPEYKHNPLYVCGESYAGKYAPSISHYIHVKNSGALDKDDVVINLTGVAIGNGDMWPVLQTRSVPDFAIALGLIDSQQYEDANAQISVCEELHRQGRDVDAFQVCQSVTQKIYEAAGNPFIYDIRQSGNTFSDLSTLLSSYFNDDAVRRALNVPPGTPWTSVDGSAYGTSLSAPALVRHLLQDEMLDVPIDVFRDLLDNYKFLFYAGNMDGSVCNNLGVGREDLLHLGVGLHLEERLLARLVLDSDRDGLGLLLVLAVAGVRRGGHFLRHAAFDCDSHTHGERQLEIALGL